MTSTNVTLTMRHNVVSSKSGEAFATGPVGSPARSKGDSQRRGSAVSLFRNAYVKAGGEVRQTFDAADLTDGVPVDGATRGTPLAVTTYGMAMGSVGVRSAARNYGAGAVALSWILAGGRGAGRGIATDKRGKTEHHKHLIVRHVSGPTIADYLADPSAYDGADGPTLEVVAAR